MEEILGLRDNGLKNNVELAQEVYNFVLFLGKILFEKPTILFRK